MAKKSRKRPARPKKDSAGCMSGLISIFDFRLGRFTQKLLPDRKQESSRHGGSVHSRNKFDVLNTLEEKHEHDHDAYIKQVRRDDPAKASIKVLMAEEMSKPRISKKIPSSRVEQLRAELGFEDNLEKNYKRKHNHNGKVGSDRDIGDSRASQFAWLDPSERSSFDVNLAELMVEFCRENHECKEKCTDTNGRDKNNCPRDPDAHVTQKHYIFQKAFRDITDAILGQSSVAAKQVATHGDVHTKEFLPALEILDSNKDIFLKLLQDPNSLLFKHIPDLQNVQAREILHGSKPEESISGQSSHKQNKHNLFNRRDKVDVSKASNESTSRGLKRIVVLKPSPANYESYSNTMSPISSPRSLRNQQHREDTEAVASHFSLKEIKRRIRNMVGDSKKGRDLIAKDGVLHKIPYGFHKSGEKNKSSSSTRPNSKLSAFLKVGDSNANLNLQRPQKKASKPTVDDPTHRESVFYEEARKRLAELLSCDSQSGASSPGQISKSLGRILSLSGYSSSSPTYSQGRDTGVDLPVSWRPSPLQKVKPDDARLSGPSTWSSPRSTCRDNHQDDGCQAVNSNQRLPGSQLNFGQELIQTGSTDTEVSESLDITVELSINDLGSNTERCIKDEESFAISEVSYEEVQSPTHSVSISPDRMLAQKLAAPGINTENLDRPSPVSVLEPFFSEDVNSPAKTEPSHAELTIEPRKLIFKECNDSQPVLTSSVSKANLATCIDDKETMLRYVRTVLEASGLHCNKLSERWQFSDQLLQQFVYDEVEIICGQVIDDTKLFFDCINEVLVEIRDRYLSCSPWMSIIKPNIRPTPTGESFTNEVCKGVRLHLETVCPYTLDRVMRKDLETGAWMNVQLETEGAVFDIGEVILEYMMEETILELWE